MSSIKWSQIEAECGDYRAGFVDTFRKYEGRDTDEIDGNNQIVKVTISSFARHSGIDTRTFRRWLGLHTPSDLDAGGERALGAAARRFANKLAPEDRAKLAAELLGDEEVANAPEVQEATHRASTRRLSRDEDDMRRRGADPDSPPEPLPHDLIAEAHRIAERADVSRDVTALLARAEADQRTALVQIIELRVRRVLDALGAGTVKVPDDLSSLGGL